MNVPIPAFPPAYECALRISFSKVHEPVLGTTKHVINQRKKFVFFHMWNEAKNGKAHRWGEGTLQSVIKILFRSGPILIALIWERFVSMIFVIKLIANTNPVSSNASGRLRGSFSDQAMSIKWVKYRRVYKMEFFFIFSVSRRSQHI